MKTTTESKTDRKGNIPQWFIAIVILVTGWLLVDKVDMMKDDVQEANARTAQVAATAATAVAGVKNALDDSNRERDRALESARKDLATYQQSQDEKFEKWSDGVTEKIQTMSSDIGYIKGVLKIRDGSAAYNLNGKLNEAEP